ncbi:MAG TPA: TlpA disulfide reductase family protein [Puia sp.]|nr:TlpA disulfide reductase family protein [Puia sp.]
MQKIIAALLVLLFSQAIGQPAQLTKHPKNVLPANLPAFHSSRQNEIFNIDRQLRLFGRIINYKADSGNGFVTFHLVNPSGVVRDTAVQVDKYGFFKAVLFQEFDDLTLYYESRNSQIERHILIEPGEIASIIIDEDKLREGADDCVLATGGKFTPTNNRILQFEAAFRRQQFTEAFTQADSNLCAEDIAAARQKRESEELAFLHDYIRNRNLTDRAFEKWEENNITYSNATDLTADLFGYPRADTTMTYERYLRCLRGIPLTGTALQNASYYRFVAHFARALTYIGNLNSLYTSKRGKYGNDHYSLVLNYANKLSQGVTRELVYADLFEPADFSRSIYAKSHYPLVISNSYIQHYIYQLAYDYWKPTERGNEMDKLLADIYRRVKEDSLTETPPFDIGDPAPPLWVREWLKGEPVKGFEKGKIYVVEFWAPWCPPCRAAFPHLSAIAKKYRDRVTIVGVNVYRQKSLTEEKLKDFMDSLGSQMDYSVADGDSTFMEEGWIEQFGARGIPGAVVIDREGKVAWIGHPRGDLDTVLSKMVDNDWDIGRALAERQHERYVRQLDEEVNNAFRNPVLKNSDSATVLLDKIFKKEPKLKYEGFVSYYMFRSLLSSDPEKAFEVGKNMIAASSYTNDNFYFLTWGIDQNPDKINLPAKIYELGAHACQRFIDLYHESVDVAPLYNKMAAFFWLAGDRLMAIEAESKAIAALKGEKDHSSGDSADFEAKLNQYKSDSLTKLN